MRDPSAVTCISRLLSRKEMHRATLIRGLEVIGDGGAAALILRLQTPGETAEMARAALSRVQRKSFDPEVKERIRAALGAH